MAVDASGIAALLEIRYHESGTPAPKEKHMARRPKTPPTIGDNSDAQDEADRVQFISVISKLSAADDEIERAKGPYDAAKAARKKIIGLGKAAGYAAKELEARLAELKEDSRKQEETIEREGKHRRWLGIIRPDQPSLGLGGEAPQEVRDQAYWRAEGYKAGLRRLSATPPDGIPERFVQAWLEERGRGAAELHTEPDAPLTAAEQARQDFAEDHPDFEASEEELSAQKPRQAVEERREATEDVT
jgi:hypothetical protein